MPGKTTARVIVAREKGESERVESSSAFARVDAVEAIEKRRRRRGKVVAFTGSFLAFKRFDSSPTGFVGGG